MYSRRNLRIKVMQALYAHNQNPGADAKQQLKWLANSVNLTQQLYLFNLHYLVSVAEYALEDAKIASNRYLKSDKKSSILIFNNSLISSILTNPDYQIYLKEKETFIAIDADRIRAIFIELKNSEPYMKFLAMEADGTSESKDINSIVWYLYDKLIYSNENFQNQIEELYPVWLDERTYIHKLVEQIVKSSQKPVSETDLKEAHEFTKSLFNTTLECENELMEHIQPKLKNWDVDRVSQVDIILLKMCLAELLFFPNIPIKVSINEYIDISKVYSGPKSKDFINGVIDKVKNDLLSKNRIKKAGRGLLNE